MTEDTLLRHRAPPSALAFMTPALLRGDRHRRGQTVVFPALRLRWDGFATSAADLAALRRLTRLPDDARLALLATHVTGFRALMRILTHRSFPLPIWRALQVRNRIVLHRPASGAGAVLEARVDGQRTLEKGAEVDVRSVVTEDGEVTWEGTTTFYYRGSFPSAGDVAPAPPRPPAVEGADHDAWRAARGVGLRLARLTGDYNPLHYAGRYARRWGFAGAFLHPQLPLGQCLARVPAPRPGQPLRIDTWVRGQVYEGDEVRMGLVTHGESTAFALRSGGEERPALVGLVSG